MCRMLHSYSVRSGVRHLVYYRGSMPMYGVRYFIVYQFHQLLRDPANRPRLSGVRSRLSVPRLECLTPAKLHTNYTLRQPWQFAHESYGSGL